FIWGLPILDTAGVMIQRLTEGRSPFSADKNHVHHKLLGIGFSHREAVMAIYGLQATLVTLAYVLRWQSDGVVLTVYGLFAFTILFLFVKRDDRWLSLNWRKQAALDEPRTGEYAWLSALPVRLLGFAIPLLLVVSVFLPAQVPIDMGYAAIGLFAVV